MKVLVVAANGGFVLGAICAELSEALVALGHEAPLCSLQNLVRTGRTAVQALKRHPPDLVIGYNYSSILQTSTGSDVFSELGVPNVAWLFDDPFKHYDERASDPSFHARLRALPRTRFVSWDAGHALRLRESGVADVDHLPPGFLASYATLGDSHTPTFESECDVGVLCNVSNGARAALLSRLCVEPLRVHAHVGRISDGFRVSPGLERALRPRLSTDEERVRFYRSSAIYLETPSNTGIGGINVKCLNAMAAGAFVLAPESPELRAAFGEDEIATYRAGDEGDLLCQVRRYLSRPAERARIARNGRAAVLRAHSMRHRVEALLHNVRRWFETMGRVWPAPRSANAAAVAGGTVPPSGVARADSLSLLSSP